METSKQVSHKKRREYNGNPLAYYESHSEKFSKWKTRKQLAIGDPGLYRALLRAGQLEESILESNNPLSNNNINKIVAAYNPCNGNVAEASQHLPYSKPTIRKYWKLNNLKAQRKSGLLESQVSEIIKAYRIHKRNISEVSRNLPYSIPTIRKYLRQNGLTLKGKCGRPQLILSKEDETLILDTYFKNRDISKTSRISNYSFYIVKKCLIKNNVEVRERRRMKKH